MTFLFLKDQVCMCLSPLSDSQKNYRGMEKKMTFKFLLVEDDAELREIITDYFVEKSQGKYSIETAASGREGLGRG